MTEWLNKAACKGQHKIFFNSHLTHKAKAICATCPVIDLCEQQAANENFLVWAGKLRHEPIKENQTKCLQCGTLFTRKRRDNVYCTNRCRDRYNRTHSERQRKTYKRKNEK